jgi:hypothetical protein
MWGNGVWLGSAVSIVIPFSVSAWIGLKFKSFWVRIVSFLIFSFVAFTIFFLFGGLWAGWHAAEDADGSIRAAFENELVGQTVFIIIMMVFALWRLPRIVNARNNRIATIACLRKF